jgi:uncharacterized repeat protein (TIGR03803 family)
MATFSVARQFLEDRIESDNMSFCNATNNLIVASESNINGSYISSIIGGKNHTIDGDNFTKNNSHILGGVGNINCCSSNSIIIGSSQSIITSSTFSSIINSNLSCICAGSAYSDIIGGFQNSIVNQTMCCGTGLSMFGFSLILSSKCSIIDNPEGVCTTRGDSTIISSDRSCINCSQESLILGSRLSSINSGKSIAIIHSVSSNISGAFGQHNKIDSSCGSNIISTYFSNILNSSGSNISNSNSSLILNSKNSTVSSSSGTNAVNSIISSADSNISLTEYLPGASGASSVIISSVTSNITCGKQNTIINSLRSNLSGSSRSLMANSIDSSIQSNCEPSLILNSNTSTICNISSPNSGWSSAIISSQGSCILTGGVILGSLNSFISSVGTGNVIIGGSGLCLSSGESNTTLVQCIKVNTVNNDNTLDRVLVHDSTDGYVKYRDLSTIGGGGGGSTAIRQNEIAFGTGTGITSSGRFTHIPNQELYSRASYTEFNGSFNATYSYTEFIGSGTNTLVNDYGYTGIISRTYSVTIDGNNVYEILYNGVYGSSSKVWLDFDSSTNGDQPVNKLIEYNNYFYGITNVGGSAAYGVIFRIKKDGTGFESFSLGVVYISPDGINPVGILIYDGYIYGVTNGSENGYGSIFRCNLELTDFQYLTEFNSSGYAPFTEPIVINNKLYGVCQDDGVSGNGCIYEFDLSTNSLNFIHYFDGTNGGQPYGPLTFYKGRLYGTTRTDGLNTSGTIFRINIDGSNFTILYALDDSSGDGNGPRNKLLIDQDIIYGVIRNGGGVADGTIFKMNIDGTGFTKLYDLNNPNCEPLLINGVLYGTEADGGTNGVGSLFKINTDGTGFEYVYDFPSSGTTGTAPSEILYSDGKFWLLPRASGSNGYGTILSINYNFLISETITDTNTSATANILGFTDLGNGTYSIVVDNPTSTISPGDIIDNGIGITASVLQINGPYDTFTWNDGDTTLSNNILNLVQNTLSYGEKIHFTSDTGNTLGDSWTWQVLIASYSTMMLLDGGQKKVSIPMMADGLNHTLGIDPQGTLVFKTDTSGLLPLPTPNVQISSFYQGMTQASISVSNSGQSGIEGYATMSRFPIVVTTGFIEDHFSNPENRIFVEMLTYKRKYKKKNIDDTVKSNKSGFVVTSRHIENVGFDTSLPWGPNFWSRTGLQINLSLVPFPFNKPNHYEVMGHTISTIPVYEYLNGRFIYWAVEYQDTSNNLTSINAVIPTVGRRKIGKRPTSRFAYSPAYTPLYVCFRYIQWIPSANGGKGQIVEGPMSKIIKVMSEQFAFNVNYSLSAIYGRPVADISPFFDPWRLNCYFESNVP